MPRGRLPYIRVATSADWLIVVQDTVEQVESGPRGRKKQSRYKHGNKRVMPLEPLSSAGCWGHFITFLVRKGVVLSRR